MRVPVMDASRCGMQRSREIEGRESRCMMTIMTMWEVPVEGLVNLVSGELVTWSKLPKIV